MAAELNIADISKLTRKDVKEVSKKMTTWKKAQGIILFNDYKLEGKYKVPVAFPFKKAAEQQAEYKKVAQTKVHKLSKVASCEMEFDATGTSLTLTIKKGGLKPEAIEAAALEIFSAVGVSKVVVTGQSDDAADIPAETDEAPVAAAEKAAAVEKAGPSADQANLIANLKSLLADKAILAKSIANIKSNAATADDLKAIEGLNTKIQTFLKDAANEKNPKLLAEIEKIKAELVPQTQKVLEKLQSLIKESKKESSVDNEFDALLKSFDKQMNEHSKDLEGIYKQLKNAPKEELPKGKAMLDYLEQA